MLYTYSKLHATSKAVDLFEKDYQSPKMMLYNLIATIALCMGLAAPPIVVLQTQQLLHPTAVTHGVSSRPEVAAVSSTCTQQQMFALEWASPKENRFCSTKPHSVVDHTTSPHYHNHTTPHNWIQTHNQTQHTSPHDEGHATPNMYNDVRTNPHEPPCNNTYTNELPHSDIHHTSSHNNTPHKRIPPHRNHIPMTHNDTYTIPHNQTHTIAHNDTRTIPHNHIHSTAHNYVWELQVCSVTITPINELPICEVTYSTALKCHISEYGGVEGIGNSAFLLTTLSFSPLIQQSSMTTRIYIAKSRNEFSLLTHLTLIGKYWAKWIDQPAYLSGALIGTLLTCFLLLYQSTRLQTKAKNILIKDLATVTYNLDFEISMLKKEKNSLTEELMEVKALKQSLWLEKAALTTDNARLVRLLAISSQKCNSLDSDNYLLRSEREAVDKSFHTLGDQHSKISKELNEVKQQNASLQAQVSSTCQEMDIKNCQLASKENDIVQLRNCLREVIDQLGQYKKDMVHSNADLITNVHIILQGLKKSELQMLTQQLRLKESLLCDYYIENKTLKAEVFAIYQQLKTAQLKFKGIIDYYTAKEHNIRQQLYHTERMLAQYKELESEAQDSLHKMRVKFERERREWTAVREQMSVVLKSLQSQVQVNQDRANKAQAFVRLSEQRIRLTDREAITIKQRYHNLLQTSKKSHKHDQRCVNSGGKSLYKAALIKAAKRQAAKMMDAHMHTEQSTKTDSRCESNDIAIGSHPAGQAQIKDKTVVGQDSRVKLGASISESTLSTKNNVDTKVADGHHGDKLGTADKLVIGQTKSVALNPVTKAHPLLNTIRMTTPENIDDKNHKKSYWTPFKPSLPLRASPAILKQTTNNAHSDSTQSTMPSCSNAISKKKALSHTPSPIKSSPVLRTPTMGTSKHITSKSAKKTSVNTISEQVASTHEKGINSVQQKPNLLRVPIIVNSKQTISNVCGHATTRTIIPSILRQNTISENPHSSTPTRPNLMLLTSAPENVTSNAYSDDSSTLAATELISNSINTGETKTAHKKTSLPRATAILVSEKIVGKQNAEGTNLVTIKPNLPRAAATLAMPELNTDDEEDSYCSMFFCD